jgi:hypothetical protein
MGSLSIFHWLIVIVIAIVTVYPYVRIIRRTGHSGWWILTAIIPVLNLAMLWAFAFTRWPAFEEERRP